MRQKHCRWEAVDRQPIHKLINASDSGILDGLPTTNENTHSESSYFCQLVQIAVKATNYWGG